MDRQAQLAQVADLLARQALLDRLARQEIKEPELTPRLHLLRPSRLRLTVIVGLIR